MYRRTALGILAGALLVAAPARADAQAAAAPAGNYLAVGTMAPDIDVVGATRYGVLREEVRLSQFRGKTVVVAFFFRARTRG
jgi:hypothetical protein